MENRLGLQDREEIKLKILEGLNPEQKEAVITPRVPLLIVAGPGTGKTKVISHRLAHLLAQHPSLKPSNLLALTFTKKAASEMEERINQLLPSLSAPPKVATFHSFCTELLRDYGLHLGIPINFKILADSLDRAPILKEALLEHELKYYNPGSDPFSILPAFEKFINRCKDELVSPAEYRNYVQGLKKKLETEEAQLTDIDREKGLLEIKREAEALRIYESYQRICQEKKFLDFGDLIFQSVELLRKRPNVLTKLREQYKCILVDEFQDTNIAQMELLYLLSSESRNVCVVGDDDQAIYRFRGASYASFNKFKEYFPETYVLKITQNFRSTKRIIATADRLIEYNGEDRYDLNKNLWTEKEEGKKVAVYSFNDYDQEAYWVTQEIKRLYQNLAPEEKSFNHFAILCRTHAHKAKVMEALRNENLPFNEGENNSLFEREEIRDLVAYLRLINNPGDNISFSRILLSSYFDFSATELSQISSFAQKKNLSFYESLTFSGELNSFSEERRERLKFLRNKIEKLRKLSKKENAVEFFRGLLEEFQLLAWESKKGGQASEERIFNLARFYEFIQAFVDKTSAQSSLKDFLNHLSLAENLNYDPGTGISPSSPEGSISLLTVHAAKGLEFRYVFLISLNEGRFPSREREELVPFPAVLFKEALPKGDFHEEEERRLFYVGITRAQKGLYLTHVEQARIKPSIFLREILSFKNELQLKEEKVTALEEKTGLVKPKIVLTEKEHNRLKSMQKIFSLLNKSSSQESLPEEIKELVSEFLKIKAFSEEINLEEVNLEKLFDQLELKKLKELLLSEQALKLGDFRPWKLPIPEKITLSHTQIEIYEWCPLKYKFKYVYRIPGIDNVVRRFGTLIHTTLEHFYRLIQDKKKMDKQAFIEIFEKSWDSLVFENRRQEESYKKRGYNVLEKYYQSNQEEFSKPPLYLEKEFQLRLEDIEINGKIDRIQELSPRHVEVVDYKTGEKEKDQKYADASLQLSIYGIAVRETLDLIPERLSLYYVEPNVKLTTTMSGEREEEARNKVRETAERIRKEEFPPCKESDRYFRCKPANCEYRLLCPVWEKP